MAEMGRTTMKTTIRSALEPDSGGLCEGFLSQEGKCSELNFQINNLISDIRGNLKKTENRGKRYSYVGQR